jgi:hypothetical protein
LSGTDAAEIVDEYLPGLEPDLRATAAAAIEVVADALPDAEHDRKWGRLTFTREGDWHHWICAVSATKKGVRLHIHKGALLADPAGLMEGEGEYIRAIPFRGPDEVEAEAVASILREAVARQIEM